MSPLETLAQIAAGKHPTSGLLHTCRFQGLGTEAYGIEGVGEQLRTARFAFTDAASLAESGSAIAIFEGERAVYADLHDGNIARLWLLAPGVSSSGEPAVSVPFDTDLAQAPGDVIFDARDHRDLAADAETMIRSIGHAIVAESAAPRTRALVIRAMGGSKAGAGLFAVFHLRLGKHENAGFVMVAARWKTGLTQIVRDTAGETALGATRWTPRVGV